MIYADVTFFENTLFQSLGSTTNPSTTLVTFPMPLEDSSSLQVYRYKKITIDSDNLSHQLIASTKVFEFPIALEKSTHSCTQHPII